MAKYEVTGYIYIPVTVEVEAETVEEALDKGHNDIDNGIGIQHDQYLSGDYYVTTEDGEPVAQYVDGELLIEGES
jgi:hypothetical protein